MKLPFESANLGKKPRRQINSKKKKFHDVTNSYSLNIKYGTMFSLKSRKRYIQTKCRSKKTISLRPNTAALSSGKKHRLKCVSQNFRLANFSPSKHG